MPNIPLEDVVKEIGVGEYEGAIDGQYAIKLPNFAAISDFQAALLRTGFQPNGITLSYDGVEFDDHYLIMFAEDFLPKYLPMDIEYQSSDEIQGPPLTPNARRRTHPAVLAFGRAIDSVYGEDLQKSYKVVVHSESIEAVAYVDTDELRLQVIQIGFDEYEVVFQTRQMDGWSDSSTKTHTGNLAQRTETTVRDGLNAWLAEQKSKRWA